LFQGEAHSNRHYGIEWYKTVRRPAFVFLSGALA
jgi:hypothetical protein